MKIETSPKIVGAFVLGAVILIVVVFVVFGTARFFADKYEYVIYFRGSVNGLEVGSPVKLRGVEIGYVEQITPIFDKKGNFYVEVLIENYTDVIKGIGIDLQDMSPAERLKFLLDRGLRAQLNIESLVLNQLYVKMDYFPETEIVRLGLNENYLEIPSVPAPREEIVQTLTHTLTSIANIPFEEISQKLISSMESFDTLVGSPKLEKSIIEMTEAFQRAQTMFTNFDERSDEMIQSLVESSQKMTETLAAMEVFVRRMDGIAAEDRYDLHSALKELSLTARSFRNLVEYLERNPNDIFFGKD
ncbi:MAG: MCE family protein [Calditrichaeota bacterium]|nr:MCE family protein [Calditrichota bacterium]RQW02270.1 MAG: MCE family protein [Calditrichota bacterium]